jgi:hypothetical protein
MIMKVEKLTGVICNLPEQNRQSHLIKNLMQVLFDQK